MKRVNLDFAPEPRVSCTGEVSGRGVVLRCSTHTRGCSLMDRETACKVVEEHVGSESLKKHMLTGEACMRATEWQGGGDVRMRRPGPRF